MAKKFKKLTVWALTLSMLLSMFSISAFAENNQVGDYLAYDESGNPGDYVEESFKSIEDGKVTLSKTIEQTGEDAFDITLQVTTTEDLEVIKRARDAAIVIVMDVSGSMQFDMSGGGYCTTCGKYKTDAYATCHGGWNNTWAKHASLDTLGVAQEHGETRFTLMENAVSAFLEDFADNSGSEAKRMVSMVCYNDKVEKELSWVNVTEATGMDAAQAVVAQGALAALTGGDTNTSLGLQRANEYLDDTAIEGIEKTYVLLLTDGAPYTAIQYKADGTYSKASGVGYDCDLTQIAADKLKEEHLNTEVYTVCFGMQGKEWTATHSVVDGVLTTTDKAFNIDTLMASIASDENHFFRGENVDEFELSLGSIVEETISHGAKLWAVTDPMGDYISYMGLKTDSAASFENDTLSWDLLAEEPVSVVDGVYTYELTYSIMLETGAEGFEYGALYPANKATSLEYALIENDELGDIQTNYFNVPTVFAEEVIIVPPSIGKKTDTLIDEKSNRYQVQIEVPGVDGDSRHDEVILMVDGSYSMDNEWPAMKEAINTIGKTVLNGSGNTQLTLMAFGMGDNEVLVHVKDAEELAAALGELPGNLLYGRSSTNCEAGFTGVANYIRNHDDSLNEANVIFISDGNINTDETPRAFDANWKQYATKFGALTVAQAAFEGAVAYGENLPAAFTTVFGDRFDDATSEEILTHAFTGGEVTEDEFYAFAEQLWTDVYAYSGLTRGAEYPVSVAERAFVKYDKENGTYIQDLFYYTTYKSSYVTYPDRWSRTPAAANALAGMKNVAAMYVVDYDSYTAWMDTGITNSKSTFVQSNGIAGLCEALEGVLTDLAKTPFNDVVVTDYMSKWVNLDATTLKIVDNSTGETIWTAAEGWLIEDNRPTAQEVPVVVELVDPADYEAGGEHVVGNTSGDIYKLTWYVKDGAMLRSDTYTLQYEVTVDTKEAGFERNTEYPANGNTDLYYTDENDEQQSYSIEVPNVLAPACKCPCDACTGKDKDECGKPDKDDCGKHDKHDKDDCDRDDHDDCDRGDKDDCGKHDKDECDRDDKHHGGKHDKDECDRDDKHHGGKHDKDECDDEDVMCEYCPCDCEGCKCCDKPEKDECNKPNKGECDKPEKDECNKSEKDECNKPEKDECDRDDNEGDFDRNDKDECDKSEKDECDRDDDDDRCDKDGKHDKRKCGNHNEDGECRQCEECEDCYQCEDCGLCHHCDKHGECEECEDRDPCRSCKQYNKDAICNNSSSKKNKKSSRR